MPSRCCRSRYRGDAAGLRSVPGSPARFPAASRTPPLARVRASSPAAFAFPSGAACRRARSVGPSRCRDTRPARPAAQDRAAPCYSRRDSRAPTPGSRGWPSRIRCAARADRRSSGKTRPRTDCRSGRSRALPSPLVRTSASGPPRRSRIPPPTCTDCPAYRHRPRRNRARSNWPRGYAGCRKWCV